LRSNNQTKSPIARITKIIPTIIPVRLLCFTVVATVVVGLVPAMPAVAVGVMVALGVGLAEGLGLGVEVLLEPVELVPVEPVPVFVEEVVGQSVP
jgi:hypothetical protein